MYTQRILHKSTSHKTITFVILEPWVEDRNGDTIHEDEIIKTAHEFMSNLQTKKVNINHQAGTDQNGVRFVESFVLPVDLTFGEDVVKQGSWLVAFKFDDEDLYDKVIKGEIIGVSMEWYWIDPNI